MAILATSPRPGKGHLKLRDKRTTVMGKESFVIKDVTPGKLNAMLSNIMLSIGTNDPAEAVRLMSSREWVAMPSTRDWWINGDLIRGRFKFDTMSGPKWFAMLRTRNVISKPAEEILKNTPHQDFGPSMCDEMVILPGWLWEVEDRTSANIRAYARKHNLFELTLEDACISRARLDKKQIQDMGLSYIVTMHNNPSNGQLLTSASFDSQEDALITHSGQPSANWNEGFGFAFGVVKKSQSTTRRMV